MIFIFTALMPEAEPLIREFSLKRTGEGSAFQQFANKERGVVLTVTGTGPVRAAAAVGFVLSGVSSDDMTLVLNFGSCAAVRGGRGEMHEDGIDSGETPVPLYLIHKLTNTESGRQWYPDLLTGNCLPEAELLSGSRLYTGDEADEMREDRSIPALFCKERLYDMEGAALFEAASLFVGPHQIHVLKFVTDSGDTEHITPDLVRHAAEAVAPRAAEYLRLILEKACVGKAAETGKTPAGSDRGETCLVIGGGNFVRSGMFPNPAADQEALARGLCASRTMCTQLFQMIRYADLMGIGWRSRVRQWADEGIYPAKDKRTGKKLLAELRDMIRGIRCADERG